MGIWLFNWFVKITAWPVQRLLLRLKISEEDPSRRVRRIRGPVILVCNHNAVYDYASLMFTFFRRTLRVQMAEVLFGKPVLGRFLRMLGGIRVDREMHNLQSIRRSQTLLEKGWAVGVFPEGRLALPGEEKPLPFQEGAALLALETGVPVVPVAFRGAYFREPIRVRIGTPMDLRALTCDAADRRAAVTEATRLLREKIIALGKELDNGA